MRQLLTMVVIGVMLMTNSDISAAENKANGNAELLAISLIARYEGFSEKPYVCPGGRTTIGYGFTDPVLVAKGKMTRQEADRELGKEVRKRLAILRKEVSGLTPKQEAAAVSLMYNIGETAFKSSTFLKQLKAKNMIEARSEIKRWNKAGGKVLAGLVKRRAAEAAWI